MQQIFRSETCYVYTEEINKIVNKFNSFDRNIMHFE